MQIVQSTSLCVLLSAVGGAIEVLATAVLAYREANERQTGVPWSRAAAALALALNVILQITSSIFGSLIAPWFGPIALVGPVFLCTQLLANMVVMGAVLGLEKFNKDMRVGTFVVVTAVVLLPVVGPTAQEYDANYVHDFMLDQWYTFAWSILMVAGMTLTATLLVILDMNKLGEWSRIGLILTARATAFTINLTVSKIMVLGVDETILLVSIVLKIVSGIVITYALIVQATSVPQNKFIPLNASALILVNAITGLLLWQDWRVMGDWVGYACVFVQLILGNYLLLGDVELLSPENARYGRLKAISMATAIVECGDTLTVTSSSSDEQFAVGAADEKEGDGAKLNASIMDGKSTTTQRQSSIGENEGEYQYWEGGEAAGVRRRPSAQLRKSSKEAAWSAVYGVDADSPTAPSHRRRSIFVIDDEEEEEEKKRQAEF